MAHAIRHGSCGCVVKPIKPHTLAKAVRTVYQGGTWFGRGVLMQALQVQLAPHVEPVPAEQGTLTRREEEIRALSARALTNKEIGRRLDISDQSCEDAPARVYAKRHQSGRYKALLFQLAWRPNSGASNRS